jgi:hypothetical protein
VTAREGDRVIVENSHIKASVRAHDDPPAIGDEAMVSVRAAAVQLANGTVSDQLNSAECDVVFVEFLGDLVKLHLSVGDERMLAKVPGDRYPSLRGKEGEKITITWSEDDGQLLKA